MIITDQWDEDQKPLTERQVTYLPSLVLAMATCTDKEEEDD
jgi:hypothetical protein